MRFFDYRSNSVRLTGRWSYEEDSAVSTACGSKIELVFAGDAIVLHFDMMFSKFPYPHIWIKVDDGAKIETALDSYIRIETESPGKHFVTIVYKSSVEAQHRWYAPLEGKIAFKGFEAECAEEINPAHRTYIEFIGDSITEGVLVDENHVFYKTSEYDNRVMQDDSTATYAYLTAKWLGLEPLIMGYGAVGLTRSGKGSVPKAACAYPYCYDGKPTSMPEPKYIVINHGANDTCASVESYLVEYGKLLDMIRHKHPKAMVIALEPFCGWCRESLGDFIQDYNEKNEAGVLYIGTKNWVSPEPLHPSRDGHRAIAEKLVERLREIIS